ncbi:hypothetical protein EGR_05028 [Echinococcus granulosus]|uniref:Uncharacterized protein n=1 Tax=Echinococcus granulosus TaxID=6210 RepID=W6UFH3_ECHGR|nr:hypothetical protein EGR_05028 [Echinococcus granulosus]EUB60175.1 hypothetical protein EGR_05028 [Echinococcus granulosus]
MRCYRIHFPANNSSHVLSDPVIQRICPYFRLCYVLCKIQRPTIALCFEKMSFMSSYWQRSRYSRVECLPAGVNHLGALPNKDLCRFTLPRYLFYIIYHQSAFKLYRPVYPNSFAFSDSKSPLSKRINHSTGVTLPITWVNAMLPSFPPTNLEESDYKAAKPILGTHHVLTATKKLKRSTIFTNVEFSTAQGLSDSCNFFHSLIIYPTIVCKMKKDAASRICDAGCECICVSSQSLFVQKRKQIICSQRNFNTVESPYAKLCFDLKESRKMVFTKCVLAKLEYLDLSRSKTNFRERNLDHFNLLVSTAKWCHNNLINFIIGSGMLKEDPQASTVLNFDHLMPCKIGVNSLRQSNLDGTKRVRTVFLPKKTNDHQNYGLRFLQKQSDPLLDIINSFSLTLTYFYTPPGPNIKPLILTANLR